MRQIHSRQMAFKTNFLRQRFLKTRFLKTNFLRQMFFKTNPFTLTLRLETYSNKIWLSYLIPTACRLTNLTLSQGHDPDPPYVTFTYLTLSFVLKNCLKWICLKNIYLKWICLKSLDFKKIIFIRWWLFLGWEFPW